MMKLAEQYFGTESDLEQIPITKESVQKLQQLHDKTIVAKLVGKEPISWVVVLPTSLVLADRFLTKQINERELLDQTKPESLYEALYLCSAFTVPVHQRHGFALELTKEAINSIPCTKEVKFFAWPYSSEGELLLKKLSADLDRKIFLRK